VFIGHLAAGLAAKRPAPRPSLGLLIAAPLFLDLIWPLFLLAGIERVRVEPGNTAFTPLAFEWYPWSHSLLMACAWGVLFGGADFAARRDRAGAFVLGALVVSHWVLDWVTHRPDLPLTPWGEARLGLGLWNSVAGTVAVEGLLFAGGVAIYAKATRARDRVGRLAFLANVVFLVVAYAANLLGPPPPDARSLAWFALLSWLLPLWAWWLDRHRDATA